MDAKYMNLKSVCITYVFMDFMKEEVDQKMFSCLYFVTKKSLTKRVK